MLDIPFGMYQTAFGYIGSSQILLVYVTTVFQYTLRYYPSGSYQIFDRYLTLMKVLHVD